jgi:hypothetical protein
VELAAIATVVKLDGKLFLLALEDRQVTNFFAIFVRLPSHSPSLSFDDHNHNHNHTSGSMTTSEPSSTGICLLHAMRLL